MKSNAQSAKAIELLTKNKCYTDALVICRTLISRLNLLILFALNPDLFDFWGKDPKNKIFLDGQIRQELANNNISLPTHLYELYSEIVHGQLEGLGEFGYFEEGLFAEVKSAENQVWVTAKFIIATIYFTALCMVVQDCQGKSIPERFRNHQILFEWLEKNFLAHNRIDQIWTFFLRDRHIEKVGKDSYIVARHYDFAAIKEQIEKFHRMGQKKKMSKSYNLKSDKE